MIRKHRRLKQLILGGLAFAALAAPASAGAAGISGILVDGMPAPVSRVDTAGSSQSYLRYHQIGIPAAPTIATSGSSKSKSSPSSSLVASATSSSFSWQDAGIGASTGLGIALLLVVGVAVARRHGQARLTSA